jgi:hypothetical protein
MDFWLSVGHWTDGIGFHPHLYLVQKKKVALIEHTSSLPTLY